MEGDIFSSRTLPKEFWLVKIGQGSNDGFLCDCQSGRGKGILIFSSKKKAEQEAKDMNATRQRMKMDQIYSAVKGKKEDIEGCAVLLQ